MLKKKALRWLLGILAAIPLSFSLVTVAFAELSVNVNCSELQVGSYPNASTCGTSPISSATPGQTYSTALSGAALGNSFSANASAKADYGILGVQAYATATNTATAPVYADDTRTMQLLSRAQSQWVDTYTIGGVAGTFVDVQVNLKVDISNFYQAASDGMLSTAYLTFNTSNSPSGGSWCMSLGVSACGSSQALHVGSNEISFITSILVGTTSTWQSMLYAEAQVYNEGIGSGEVNINALNTAHSYFTVLTEGASMGWSSGNDYSVPSPVPEPEIYAMLGVGLGFMGWVARRRKQQTA